jgi:hypothetical protein
MAAGRMPPSSATREEKTGHRFSQVGSAMLPFAGPSAFRAAKAEASVTSRLALATDVARGRSGATNVAGTFLLDSGPLAESSCGETCLYGFRSTRGSEGGNGSSPCCLRFLCYLILGPCGVAHFSSAELVLVEARNASRGRLCLRVIVAALWHDDGVGAGSLNKRLVVRSRPLLCGLRMVSPPRLR